MTKGSKKKKAQLLDGRTKLGKQAKKAATAVGITAYLADLIWRPIKFLFKLFYWWPIKYTFLLLKFIFRKVFLGIGILKHKLFLTSKKKVVTESSD